MFFRCELITLSRYRKDVLKKDKKGEVELTIKLTTASSTVPNCIKAIRRSLGKNLKFAIVPCSVNISWIASSVVLSLQEKKRIEEIKKKSIIG